MWKCKICGTEYIYHKPPCPICGSKADQDPTYRANLRRARDEVIKELRELEQERKR